MSRTSAITPLLIAFSFSTASLAAQSSQDARWQTYDNQAQVLMRAGKFDEALTAANTAVNLASQVFGPEDVKTTDSLLTLAFAYSLKNDRDRAESLSERVLTIREKILGPEHPATVFALDRFAAIYFNWGELVHAQSLHRRVLALREKSFGLEHPVTLSAVEALARDLGFSDEALSLYMRVLQVRERTLGIDHVETARVMVSIAYVMTYRRNYVEAERFYRRLLPIYEQHFGPQDLELIKPLRELSSMYALKGDYSSAESVARRGLAIEETRLGADNPQTLDELDGLANLTLRKGDVAGAESNYQHVLTLKEAVLGPNDNRTINTVFQLAVLKERIGDMDEAIALTQRGLAFDEDRSFDAGARAAAAELARLYLKRGDLGNAEAMYWKAWHYEERRFNRQLALGAEQEKQSISDAYTTSTYSWVSLSLLHPQRPRLRELAFTAVATRKGRVADTLRAESIALKRQLSPEDRSALDQLMATRTRLAQLSMAGLQVNATDHQSETKILSEKEQRLSERLSEHSRAFRSEEESPTPDRLRTELPNNGALIEFYRQQLDSDVNHQRAMHYVAFILRADTHPVDVVDLGNAPVVDDLCRQFVVSLRTAANAAQTRQIARRLEALVMEPLRRLLVGRNEVLIAPDGDLNLIPFAALIDENHQYLLERFQFTYLSSGRDLLRFREPAPSRQPIHIIANPDFGPARHSGCQFESRSGFLREAEALSKRMPGAEVMLGSAATTDLFRRLAGPKILHVATHGFFFFFVDCMSGSGSAMVRSGLALTGANNIDSHQGILTALEIEDLDLWGTQLVVLSACETGVGEVRSGEGVFGLRRALVIAGSQSQVMSLWAVDDEGTREVMIEYYEQLLAGAGRSAAMRIAQRSMLNNGRDVSSWAAFIPSGDWSPLP